MHITARAIAGLPSFRRERIARLFWLQFRRLNDASFQIVHFSIQTNHVHLIVEAADVETVSRKMAGFMISFAKRLNRQVLGNRRGKVWSDRYFRRDITHSRDMHSVLRYVFGNAKRHGHIAKNAPLLDSFSSAWTFDGWDLRIILPDERYRWKPPRPRTDLLERDWIACGLLRVEDCPGPQPN